ncbi:MAG: spore maturation protein [Blautia sp.]|jgi:spore maturation protein B
MKLLTYLSYFIVPFLIFYILALGYSQKQNVYEDFLEGAKEGLKIVVRLVPTLVGLLAATGILRASGFLDFVGKCLGQFTAKAGLAPELLPVAIIRLFSASAATGLVLDIFKEYGADSLMGLTASVMMSCTETVFYTMSIYFAAAKIAKTRYTLGGALLASAAGIAASVVISGFLV